MIRYGLFRLRALGRVNDVRFIDCKTVFLNTYN